MRDDDTDPKSKLRRLFGDSEGEEVAAPFGGADPGVPPRQRLAAATVRLRRLRGQVSAEGLTPNATRSLLDEVVLALEAVNEALRALEEDG